LDWSINKNDPQLIVAVGQEEIPDSQVCSYCGRILELSFFPNNRSIKTGKSRVCRECMSKQTVAARPNTVRGFAPRTETKS
jgi:DNA-directed RNA polymerase subunit RPC12/RpoP